MTVESDPRRRYGTAAHDVLVEAIFALRGRPLGALLSAVAVAVGVGGIVGIMTVSAGASASVSNRFDMLNSTLVTFMPAGRPASTDEQAQSVARIENLNGVRSAGRWAKLTGDPVGVARAANLGADAHVDANVVAADVGALSALELELVHGRFYDSGHTERRDPVAVVDQRLARDLGLSGLVDPVLIVNGSRYVIVGVFAAPADAPEAIGAVVIPPSRAADVVDDVTAMPIVARTDQGASVQVVGEGPTAANPLRPSDYAGVVSSAPRGLRGVVEDDVRVLLLGVGLVTLAAGTLGIATSMTMNAMQRTQEVGIRRATGATRRAVAAQFLIESVMLGFAGGILGAWMALVGATAAQQAVGWVPVVQPDVILAAPTLGIIAGTLAGLIPAYRASRMQPAHALRL